MKEMGKEKNSIKNLLFFAKILSEELRNVYDIFYEAGYEVLNFSSHSTYGRTKLRMENNQYIVLEDLYDDMELEDLLIEIQTEEGNIKLEDYSDDYGTEETGNFKGILFTNVYLYELLYDFGMLGEKFYDEKKDNAVKNLLRMINVLASEFDFDLHFVDGRIYITGEKDNLENNSYICRNMMEIDFVNALKGGATIINAREAAGMSKEDFEYFNERLNRHQWRQTSTYKRLMKSLEME